MATNGSFNTSAYSDRYLTFSWKQVSQDIVNNSTTISWELKGAGGSSGKYYITGNFKVVIDGETVYTHKDTIQLKHQVVASGTKTIYHNSDGNRNFTASASAGIYAYTSSNASGSGSWDLTQIPRFAKITSAPNFNDEENPTMQYSNPAGNAVSTLEACIATYDGQVIVPYRAVPKTGTSYKFQLTEADRNNLRVYSKNANSTTIKFYLHSKIGTQSVREKLNKTLTIINAAPALNPTVKDINTKTVAITGDSNKLIRYQSTIEAVCNASAKKGASIVSYKITNSGKVSTANKATFYEIGSGDTFFEATDSRGNVVKKTISKTCFQYVNSSISIKNTKLNADGSLDISFGGNIYTGSLGSKNNANWAYVRYKEQGGNWVGEGNGYKSISDKMVIGNYQTYTIDTKLTGLDYTKTYVIQCAIEDSLSFKHTQEKVVVSKPVFSWGKDEFNFNCTTITGSVYSLEGIPERNKIKPGADFNNYTQPGVYTITSSSYMEQINNTPPIGNLAGRLIVESGLGEKNPGGIWNYLMQRFIPYNATGVWVRYAYTGKVPGAWTWNKWVEQLSTNEVKDYIVAQATSGIWEYRKWNSGKAECWAKLYCAKCPKGYWGNIYAYDLVGSRLALPFTFKYTPTIIATLETTNQNVWLATKSEAGVASKSYTDAYQAVRPTDGTNTIDMRVDYYVYGQWK